MPPPSCPRPRRMSCSKAGWEIGDVSLIIPHQANTRIIESAAKRLGLPMDKFFVNLERYGNTSAASIPIALTEAISARQGAAGRQARARRVRRGADVGRRGDRMGGAARADHEELARPAARKDRRSSSPAHVPGCFDPSDTRTTGRWVRWAKTTGAAGCASGWTGRVRASGTASARRSSAAAGC